MITRRATFGMAAGAAALISFPALGREPRHLIYWNVEMPNFPVPDLAYYKEQAENDFRFRHADLSTFKYWGIGTHEDIRLVRHYWQCERTGAGFVAWKDGCDAAFEESLKAIGRNYQTGGFHPKAEFWRQQRRDARPADWATYEYEQRIWLRPT